MGYKPEEKVIPKFPIKKSRKIKLNLGDRAHIRAYAPTDRFTLRFLRCYLDSCATYHPFCVKEFPSNVCTEAATMKESCNVGTVSANTREWYGELKV